MPPAWAWRLGARDVARFAFTLALCVAIARSCGPTCAERCASKGYTRGRDVGGNVCECSGDTLPDADRSGGS